MVRFVLMDLRQWAFVGRKDSPMVGHVVETKLRGYFLDEAALDADAFLVDIVDKRSFLLFKSMWTISLGENQDMLAGIAISLVV